MPASSGHHHREPHPRKVYGKDGGPVPAGRPRHDYEPTNGGARCSCGRWVRIGSEFVIKPMWRVHVREARKEERRRDPKPRRKRETAELSPRQQLLNELWRERNLG
jgi:hypothetical protein